ARAVAGCVAPTTTRGAVRCAPRRRASPSSRFERCRAAKLALPHADGRTELIAAADPAEWVGARLRSGAWVGRPGAESRHGTGLYGCRRARASVEPSEPRRARSGARAAARRVAEPAARVTGRGHARAHPALDRESSAGVRARSTGGAAMSRSPGLAAGRRARADRREARARGDAVVRARAWRRRSTRLRAGDR